MTKAELIEKLQEGKGAGLSKKVLNELVDELFDQIAKTVRKEKRFQYPNFGTFSVKKRKARVGRNPKTGEQIEIKPTKTVVFKPSPLLKNNL
ncbi:MAG: HU family DNA-binding protein [Deltaproteobacteria bacterium]|nr:HU family DNA-binding protein [Deltaproteobacteria bacterium]